MNNEVQLFEVGGSIRDGYLGVDNDDRDFVAVCSTGWNGLLDWAHGFLDKIFLVRPDYFTIRGIKRGHDAAPNVVYDIVLARKDGAYSDGRRPDSVEPGTLEDDLGRRDFTMNAIASNYGWDFGTVIDPFDGVGDIQRGVIRCVGSTDDRIREDSLRILRAMRFAVTKPGMSLDSELQKLVEFNEFDNGERVSDLLINVSRERVCGEVFKMFNHNTIESVLMMDLAHPDLRKAIFGDDLWLKPTLAKR